MKKSTVILCAACVGFVLTSCKPKLKDCKGLVTQVEFNQDTLKSMKVQTADGEFIFNLKDVRFNEGIMMKNDSVIVNYIQGRHDTLRALVVTVLPKSAHYIDIKKDTTKELLTSPLPVDSILKRKK